MIKRFQNRIRQCISSEKGLSLLELVVAVAILAALSSILLHAFVTSNSTTNKARRISEATEAGQNIQETIESMRVSEFFKAFVEPTTDADGDTLQNLYRDNVTQLLSLSGDSVLTLGSVVNDALGDFSSRSTTITNISSGKSKFDAKITFSAGSAEFEEQPNGEMVVDLSTADGFYLINKKKVCDYVTPDVTYLQPYKAYDNPDNIADETFKNDRSNYNRILKKSRKIVFDITTDENDCIDVKATWNYTYQYSVKADRNSTEDHIDNISSTGISEFTTSSETLVLAGKERPEDDGFITVYFMYYPCYSDYQMRITSFSDTVGGGHSGAFADTFELYNLEDLPVRIILVKQVPMIQNTLTGDYAAMDTIKSDATVAVETTTSDSSTGESTTAETTTAVSNSTKYGMPYGYLYDYYEQQYWFYMYEYHSNDYISNFNVSSSAPTFMTNAGIQLQTLETNNVLKCPTVVYEQRGRDTYGHSGEEKKTAQIIADGSLVNKQSFERLYDVTIDIYSAGDLENSEPVYHASFKTSKIN